MVAEIGKELVGMLEQLVDPEVIDLVVLMPLESDLLREELLEYNRKFVRQVSDYLNGKGYLTIIL